MSECFWIGEHASRPGRMAIGSIPKICDTFGARDRNKIQPMRFRLRFADARRPVDTWRCAPSATLIRPRPTRMSGSSWRIEVVERVAGIEPALQAWEAGALPLHHTRARATSNRPRLWLQGLVCPYQPTTGGHSHRPHAPRSPRAGTGVAVAQCRTPLPPLCPASCVPQVVATSSSVMPKRMA